jgi:hypothetical protein
MIVEIGTEAPIFLFWEYLLQIFGILSLQCVACFVILGDVSNPESCRSKQLRYTNLATHLSREMGVIKNA